jgi:hypothetical protein
MQSFCEFELVFEHIQCHSTSYDTSSEITIMGCTANFSSSHFAFADTDTDTLVNATALQPATDGPDTHSRIPTFQGSNAHSNSHVDGRCR